MEYGRPLYIILIVDIGCDGTKIKRINEYIKDAIYYYDQYHDKSFEYYLRAANLGCTQAWPALNRLAKNSDARQQQLSQSSYGYFFKKKSITPLPKNNSTPSLQHRR